MSDNCIICYKPVEGYEPKYCCSGHDCGCMGQPQEPCICSNECWDALMMDGPLEERREKAGIPLWQEPCDHEWKTIDESFSHEFGTEMIFREECQKCGESHDMPPGTKPLKKLRYDPNEV